jgi:hypothetical protein
MSQPQDHSVAGSILSKKNSNDTIGNRNRDLPAFYAVSPPPSAEVTPPLGLHGLLQGELYLLTPLC